MPPDTLRSARILLETVFYCGRQRKISSPSLAVRKCFAMFTIIDAVTTKRFMICIHRCGADTVFRMRNSVSIERNVERKATGIFTLFRWPPMRVRSALAPTRTAVLAGRRHSIVGSVLRLVSPRWLGREGRFAQIEGSKHQRCVRGECKQCSFPQLQRVRAVTSPLPSAAPRRRSAKWKALRRKRGSVDAARSPLCVCARVRRRTNRVGVNGTFGETIPHTTTEFRNMLIDGRPNQTHANESHTPRTRMRESLAKERNGTGKKEDFPPSTTFCLYFCRCFFTVHFSSMLTSVSILRFPIRSLCPSLSLAASPSLSLRRSSRPF